MRFDEKTITINHHNYVLNGFDYSNHYEVSIIPDYYDMFEDGMACNAGAVCYDMGDTIDVHYIVSITPKGKNKSKVVLDEEETIDKEDFDYINDSVFVMICEWIDNRYGKELFESKKSIGRKSLKEENNRQKVTEGIMKYFDDVFPLIEKDDAFRFSMYTKKDVMIGVEVFKDYIFVGLFNLDGKNNLDEYIKIPRETYGSIEDEILYDSDAIFEYLEEYKLV